MIRSGQRVKSSRIVPSLSLRRIKYQRAVKAGATNNSIVHKAPVPRNASNGKRNAQAVSIIVLKNPRLDKDLWGLICARYKGLSVRTDAAR